ncbi:glycosyltransferase family 2 protein [Flavobacterium tegetincola]|uniref:glycosyltransferase family 2 protein n=1 Tax=Flavobacterium tegetincola TaxID=150172 RepID=UPI0003FEC45A|nr:glycosyltransferase family 2 protein [Flavobacterium tegetincola]
MTNDLLITVFVPVYNGEKYLEHTLQSIQQQTYANIEILLVDDSSTDGSLEILNHFAEKDARFKVFVKENGGIVAKSMNYIMHKIQGAFFFYSSQDDLFSPDLIEKMVSRQIETAADTVLPDMEFYFEGNKDNAQIIGLNSNKNIQLKGKEACYASLNWTIHGFAMFKSSLVQSEFFPEDAFDSDEYVTRKLFLKSNKIVFSGGLFYYRQDNEHAITKSFSKKNFYVLNTSWKLLKLLKENNFDEEVVFKHQLVLMQQYLDFRILYERYCFESEDDKNEVNLFLNQFKENNFKTNFYYTNFNYVIRNLKFYYLGFVLVVKSPVLFKIFRIYKKLKS